MDRNVFRKHSDVYRRTLEYSALFEEIYIVVFSEKKHNLVEQKISDNVFLYPTNSPNRWFYIFDAYKIGKKIIKEKNLNSQNCVITTQDPFETGLAGWFLSLKSKIKFHMQIHTDLYSRYFTGGHLLNNIRIIVAKFLIPRANGIRVVSERIRQSLIRNWKLSAEGESQPKADQPLAGTTISGGEIRNSKIYVLPIFVDIEKIENAIPKIDLREKYPQFEKIILMVSRIENEKNIPLALRVFKKVIGIKPKTGLIIVGEGKMKTFARNLTKSLKLFDNVIFEKWSDDLISYYKTADMFLLTSDYEGYGLTIVEAIIAGCPVITSNVGLVGDVVVDKKDVLVCEPRDEKCFFDSILKLIGDAELRNKLKINAKTDLKEKMIISKEEYLCKYREILENC